MSIRLAFIVETCFSEHRDEATCLKILGEKFLSESYFIYTHTHIYIMEAISHSKSLYGYGKKADIDTDILYSF